MTYFFDTPDKSIVSRCKQTSQLYLKVAVAKIRVNTHVYRRSLMKIIVHYYATLRQVVGSRQVDFVLPNGGTLRRLVEEMVGRYPDLRNEILDPQGNLYGHIHIFINGRDSTFLDDSMNSILEPED